VQHKIPLLIRNIDGVGHTYRKIMSLLISTKCY